MTGFRARDAGAGPGEQTGRCLFGIRGATVFMLKDGARGDGVGVCWIGRCRTMTVAIVTLSSEISGYAEYSLRFSYPRYNLI